MKIHPQLHLKVTGYIIKLLWVKYSYRDSTVKMICGIYLFVFKMNKNGLAFRRLLVMSLSRRSSSRLWSNELLARTCLLKNFAVNNSRLSRSVTIPATINEVW